MIDKLRQDDEGHTDDNPTSVRTSRLHISHQRNAPTSPAGSVSEAKIIAFSTFTSAPPNMHDSTLPGQSPPLLFFPPFLMKKRKGVADDLTQEHPWV